ncbi:MAG: portal protein [Henriciella sp.]|jgi:CPA2 family monovalent cation:H+ antiporter-2|uniref:cation:proton antiporter domain-containing protein n=1 Tax=Henriciella sp. TaxID=1968823 RepID=UPI000C10A998|nr:cation:proton antiporter [Henriciella sp.]MAN72671.1 portal protein [Henriciella sp.]MBF34437.1 portal protein [Hyphomonadaceae bacterium]MBK76503.1 portal protein [Henriciella sp.]PHR80017.1 MAG: portal protein [Henriciella sp.]|tara:strand:+ start:2044 stop:3789 length:1746 start_codon:yes stop_codon:yes gene_type:complete
MGHEGQEIFLKDMLVFLFAAGVIVPALRMLRIPAVAGFLIAGVVLGPYGLGTLEDLWAPVQFVTVAEPEAAEPFAELGILFLLFLIGLELSFEKLWRMRQAVFGTGALQAFASSTAIGTGLWLLGLEPAAAAVIGLALALSSTAIVMQTLTTEHRATGPTGRTALGVLLFQDILVAPILILIGFLSAESGDGGLAGDVLRALGEGLLALVVIVAIGRFAVRPAFRLAAKAGGRDFLMAVTLFTVIGAAVISATAGLSVALGAFLAGLLLGETEFRHQTEIDLDPFKGLLLGIFFMTVGMSIDLAVALELAPLVLGGLASLIALKLVIAWVSTRLFGASAGVATESAFLLAPAGEFAFVVMAAATGAGLLTTQLATPVTVIAGLSMLLIPLTSKIGQMIAARYQEADETEHPPTQDFSELDGHVIIAGFGRVGRTITRILDETNTDLVILERDPALVRAGRQDGWQVSFGDAARPEMLEAAGLDGASMVVITVDDADAARDMVAAVRRLRPALPILARARDAEHGRDLEAAGATFIIPDAIEAALQLSGRVLSEFGYANETVRDLLASEREEAYRQGTREPS